MASFAANNRLLGASTRIETAARIVDPYFPPTPLTQPSYAQIETPGLARLAEGLSNVAPQLMRAMQVETEEFRKEETLAAVADRQQSMMNYADAVSSGEIPAGASPYYVKAYQEEDGRLSANRYKAWLELDSDWQAFATRDFDDEELAAAALSEFVGLKRAEFLDMQGEVPDSWIIGFRSQSAGVENALATDMIAARTEENERKFTTAVENRITQSLLVGETPEEIGASLTAISSESIGQFGLDGTEFNNLVTDVVVANAQAAAVDGNYDLARQHLAVLQNIQTNEGPLAGRFETMNQTSEAYTFIREREEAEIRWGHYQEDRDYKDRTQPIIERNLEIQNAIAEANLINFNNQQDIQARRLEVGLLVANDPFSQEALDAIQRLRQLEVPGALALASEMQELMVKSAEGLRNPDFEPKDPDLYRGLQRDAISGTLSSETLNEAYLDEQIDYRTFLEIQGLAGQSAIENNRMDSSPPVVGREWDRVEKSLRTNLLQIDDPLAVYASFAPDGPDAIAVEQVISRARQYYLARDGELPFAEMSELDVIRWADEVMALATGWEDFMAIKNLSETQLDAGVPLEVTGDTGTPGTPGTPVTPNEVNPYSRFSGAGGLDSE